MRSFWMGALAAAAAVSIGACAAGTTESSPQAIVGNDVTADAGTQAASGSDDSGTVSDPTSEDSGTTTPNSEDSGQTSSPPKSEDSGTISPHSDDSGVASEDSGQLPTEDSGPPATGASTCPDTATYFEEWLLAPASAAVCTTGSDCPTTQCCYGANVGAGLCVAL